MRRQVGQLFLAFSSPLYRTYFIALAVSVIGTNMQMVAIPWLAYRLTGSAVDLGIVIMVRQLANFLLSPLVGVLADRYPLRNLMIISQSVIVMISIWLGWLIMSDVVQIWQIIVFQIIMGLVWGIELPVRNVFIFDLVADSSHRLNATALHSGLFNTGRVIGPLIAGVTIAAVGEWLCIVFHGLSFLGVIGVLMFMRLPDERTATNIKSISEDITDGFRTIWSNTSIRYLFVLTHSIGLFVFAYEVLLPVFVRDVFASGPEVLGMMNTSIGVGAIAGIVILAVRKNYTKLEHLIWSASLLNAVGVIAFAISKNIWLAMFFLFATGVGKIVVFTATKAILKNLAPEGTLGRVMSLYIGIFMGATGVGSIMLGTLAEYLSPYVALTAGGVACLAVSIVTWGKKKGIAQDLADSESRESQVSSGSPQGGVQNKEFEPATGLEKRIVSVAETK